MTKLKDFKAIDADRFFQGAAQALSKASLVKIKSTLTRSIRRARSTPSSAATSSSWLTYQKAGLADHRGL
jgi:hypothetical protein